MHHCFPTNLPLGYAKTCTHHPWRTRARIPTPGHARAPSTFSWSSTSAVGLKSNSASALWTGMANCVRSTEIYTSTSRSRAPLNPHPASRMLCTSIHNTIYTVFIGLYCSICSVQNVHSSSQASNVDPVRPVSIPQYTASERLYQRMDNIDCLHKNTFAKAGGCVDLTVFSNLIL